MKPDQIPVSPTIKELAMKLGISHSTVSRALRDHPAISEKTRDTVKAMAAQLGYIPNNAARALKHLPSPIVGLVIPDIGNSYYSGIAKQMAALLMKYHCQMVLSSTNDDPKAETMAVRSLLEARVRGVIITPSVNLSAETASMLARLNTVQLGREHPALHTASTVAVDDARGIADATAHVYAHGHTRIGYIGSRETVSTGRNRVKGYRETMEKLGLAYTPQWIWTGPSQRENGQFAFEQIMALRNRPSALVVGSPELALGVMVAARRAGFRIPGDVSLVSYGECPWYELIEGGVTAISLPEEKLARDAMSILFEQSDTPRRSIHAPTLLSRGSVRAVSPCDTQI